MTINIGLACELGVDAKSVRSFFRENWPRRIALAEERFYQWQFIQPPRNGNCDCNCVAIDKDSQIIGVMGLNKRNFVLDRKLLPAAELTTWIVSPRGRGTGVGASMLQFLTSRFDIMFGSGISGDALPVYLKSGFHFKKEWPRFTRIWNLERSESFCKLEKLGRQLVSRRAQTRPFAGKIVEPDKDFHDDAVLEHTRHFDCYERSDLDLGWRYSDHPIFSYHSSCLETDKGKVTIFYRIDEIEHFRILHLLDCLGNPNAFGEVANYLDHLSKELDLCAGDFYCTSPVATAHFRSAGWFSISDEPFIQLFNLFYPPEPRIPATTSLILWGKDHKEAILNFGRLYMTKGDLDLDRPTFDFYEKHGRESDFES